MPRQGNQAVSSFSQLQRQARQALADLRKEIRTREAELRRLEDQALRLGRLVGGGFPAAANGTKGASRIDWRVVLSKLPKQFKAANIRSERSLRHKPSAQIFAAITRWIDAGLVKRKAWRLYERVEQRQGKSGKTA